MNVEISSEPCAIGIWTGKDLKARGYDITMDNSEHVGWDKIQKFYAEIRLRLCQNSTMKDENLWHLCPRKLTDKLASSNNKVHTCTDY